VKEKTVDRKELSDRIFRFSWTVTRLPTTLRRAAVKAAERTAAAVGRAVRKLGAIMRGCGCDDDDAEFCERRKVTDRKWQSWCKCDCHDGNTAAASETSGMRPS
jgi:hypothetical protein